MISMSTLSRTHGQFMFYIYILYIKFLQFPVSVYTPTWEMWFFQLLMLQYSYEKIRQV